MSTIIKYFIRSMFFIMIFVFVENSAFSDEKKFPFSIYIKSDQLTFIEGNRAEIEVCVRNLSTYNSKFKIYEPLYTTFQPIVYDDSGREAQTKVGYRLENKRTEDFVKALAPRETEIAPGETICSRMDLNSFYVLKPDTKYRVRVLFLPDAKTQTSAMLGENSLYIKIKAFSETERYVQFAKPEQGISPSEVVTLFLNAEKKKNWRDYIKYVEPEKYINSFPDFAKEYNSANDVIRRNIVTNFKTYLTRARTDYILDYEITGETMLDRYSSIVTARVKREGSGKPFVFDCKYQLEKFSDYWRITDVTATIITR